MTPPLLVIWWLTLLLCMWTTGDQVVDLVFEEPDVAVDASPVGEEPDNAAEHVLMPSSRTASSAVSAAVTSADLGAPFIALSITDHSVPDAAASDYRPPPLEPLSLSVPLRI